MQKMKNFILALLIFSSLFPLIQIHSQDFSSYKQHAFSRAFVFTGEGGLTLSLTDYKKNGTGFASRLSGEYFFPTTSAHS
jgi:hypothetical protein